MSLVYRKINKIQQRLFARGFTGRQKTTGRKVSGLIGQKSTWSGGVQGRRFDETDLN